MMILVTRSQLSSTSAGPAWGRRLPLAALPTSHLTLIVVHRDLIYDLQCERHSSQQPLGDLGQARGSGPRAGWPGRGRAREQRMSFFIFEPSCELDACLARYTVLTQSLLLRPSSAFLGRRPQCQPSPLGAPALAQLMRRLHALSLGSAIPSLSLGGVPAPPFPGSPPKREGRAPVTDRASPAS